jgi:hypothetical protein
MCEGQLHSLSCEQVKTTLLTKIASRTLPDFLKTKPHIHRVSTHGRSVIVVRNRIIPSRAIAWAWLAEHKIFPSEGFIHSHKWLDEEARQFQL